jgi:hypothetical protein
VWNELDYAVAIALTNWLPNHWYRVHAPTARLRFAVENFLGAKHPTFVGFLEPWMRPDLDEQRVSIPPFSTALVADVDLAFDLGFLSQSALVALGPTRLRQAGAFKADRVVDTTIRG